MRIVTLEPFLAELVCAFNLEHKLVGVALDTVASGDIAKLPTVTTARLVDNDCESLVYRLEDSSCTDLLETRILQKLDPDCVLTSVPFAPELVPQIIERIRFDLKALLGHEIQVFSYNPVTLNQIFEMFETLAKDLGHAEKGKALVNKVKAQVMNWGDNFYERMKGKRVTFVSSLDPLCLGGLWIPDMIKLASAVSQAAVSGKDNQATSWAEVVSFRPDVLLIAPRYSSLEGSARSFKKLEKDPNWNDILAVKRGEVYFIDGHSGFYEPGPRIMDAMAILYSALAGFESGYITPRDSFYKLRWLELHRHKF